MSTSKSVFRIFLGTIALFSLIAAINNDFSFSAKAFLEALSHVRFKNEWLNSLQDLSNAFDKVISMSSPLDFITGLFELQFSVISGVCIFLLNFLQNILVVFRFLYEFGFKL